MPEARTAERLIKWAADLLKAKSIENYRSDAEMLLSEVLGLSRTGIHMNRGRVLSDDEISLFRQYVNKRGEGIPLQYIIKKAYFYGRPFIVEEGCFIPQFCTEVLVEQVIRAAAEKKSPVNILEVGGGSGAPGITAALEIPGSRVTIIEKEEGPYGILLRNIAFHGMEERVKPIKGDYFDIDDCGAYDMIMSNPPYIAEGDALVSPEVLRHIPHAALFAGPDGLDFYRRFAAKSEGVSKGALLFFEIGYNQAREIGHIFNGRKATFFKDLEGHRRVVRID